MTDELLTSTPSQETDDRERVVPVREPGNRPDGEPGNVLAPCRPSFEQLRQRPTSRREVYDIAGVEGTFELKLEKAGTRFWICLSATVKEPGTAVLDCFLADHVTVEELQPSGEWVWRTDGPDATATHVRMRKLVAGTLAWLKGGWKELQSRYGPKYTRAILAVVFVALFVPVPGVAPAAAALVVAVAEVHRAVSGRRRSAST